jgi:CRISPR-associated endoribonuclease Cas6
MVPFGHGAPIFPQARRDPGVYAAGGRGSVELGSPLPGMVDAWLDALSNRGVLDWGGVALNVRQLVPVAAPPFTSGRAELRTTTPVVLKSLALAGGDGGASARRELLPHEEGFTAAFEHNLRRKAETLGVEPDIALERLTWVGAKRSFSVKSGRRVGALLGVELRGSPALLRALWCWGLGQANAAGFGWVSG